MQSAWFETFFQGPAVEFWNRAMTPALTISDVDFLERELGAEPGARLLDIPCGNGRHALELARRGFQMTALDLSEEFLAGGRRQACEEDLRVDWRRGDMRSLELPAGAYGGAYCVGNSFGYLDRREAVVFLQSIARALTSGSRLVIETGMCAESILPSLLQKRWHRFGDLVVLSECRYVTSESRLDIDYTFIQGSKVETRPSSSYVVTAAELRSMLQTAGFREISMYGGMGGEPFQLGSPRLVVSARA